MTVAEKTPRKTTTRRNSNSSKTWTCDRCAVNVSWVPGSDAPKLPTGWEDNKRGTHCLLCRRALAAESALDDAPSDTTRENRAKLRSAALIEFEIKRDPLRGNGEIARACRSSVPAVVKARARLGIAEPVR